MSASNNKHVGERILHAVLYEVCAMVMLVPLAALLTGSGMGQMGVLLVANFMDVATFAQTLAAMIGLGVGIDYGLFVMNRYRQGLLHGHDPKKAAMESVETRFWRRRTGIRPQTQVR